MAYDDTSFYGDWITDEYDLENNPLNPESPFGFYIYKLLGNGFDTMSSISSQFLDDSYVLSCLDKFIPMYGRYWGLERPMIDDRYLTDKEYRVYLYLKKCRLLTMQDLEVCFNNCMTLEDYDVYVRVYTDLADFLEVVDHPHYTPNEWTVISNILKLDYDQSKDWIVGNRYETLPEFTYNDLQALIDEAESGDIIYLKGIYKYDEDVDDDAKITINKDLTIVGQGSIIDGNDTAKCFYISNNNPLIHPTVLIDDCIIQNCYASSGGAALYIYNSNNSVIKNTVIKDSTADSFGGAIQTDNCNNLTIDNCVFLNNSSLEAGAVYFYGTNNSIIKNSTFMKCSANLTGGGFSCMVSNNATIDNCVFNGCTSNYEDSGAINWSSSSGNGAVINCIFITETDTVKGIEPTTTENNAPLRQAPRRTLGNPLGNQTPPVRNLEQELEEVHRIIGRTGHFYHRIVVVEVPAQGWDPRFLELLSEFISVKGNIIVKEYSV